MFREVCLTEFDQKKATQKRVECNTEDIITENLSYSPAYKGVEEFSGSFCFTLQFSKLLVKERVLTW